LSNIAQTHILNLTFGIVLEGDAPDFARPTSRLKVGWHVHYCSLSRSRRARLSSAEAAAVAATSEFS
ncbi:MAG: hypothetical protein WB586_01890, partial [Chthoniobacterales bacterium]